MGKLEGGSSKSKDYLWGPQQQYLKTGMANAQGVYDSKAGTPWYSGELFAGLNGGGQDILSHARAMMERSGLSSGELSGAGSRLMGNGMGGLDEAMARLRDPNGALNMGNAFANSDVANGLVDAASRDVTRNLNEEQLPALNLRAIGSGNMNSSRTGAKEGILTRGAQDRIADTSAGIRGALFDRGASEYGAGADRLWNGVMGSLGQGAGMFGQALSQGFDAQNNLMSALGFEQGNRQGANDAEFSRWQGNDTRAFDLLQQLFGMIGGNLGTKLNKSSSWNAGLTVNPGSGGGG